MINKTEKEKLYLKKVKAARTITDRFKKESGYKPYWTEAKMSIKLSDYYKQNNLSTKKIKNDKGEAVPLFRNSKEFAKICLKHYLLTFDKILLISFFIKGSIMAKIMMELQAESDLFNNIMLDQ